MNDVNLKLEEHTAGPQSLGFDYQFYYFVYLALKLDLGQKVGFEVKDDVHIDMPDGTTVLLQTKHSVLTNASGTIQNLTDLDLDLWKTLNNWASFIKADSIGSFLDKHSFILVTNKSNSENSFIKALKQYQEDEDFEKFWSELIELENKSNDKTIKKYFKTIKSIGKRKLKIFCAKLAIETGEDSIIQKIKERIFESVRQRKLVDPVFDSLISNLHVSKYLEIKNRAKFEITLDEFNEKFGKCFQPAFESKPLPSRNIPILLPENLEEQIFIKQLLDIGEVASGSNDIRNYTTQMLKFLNDFTLWADDNYLLPTEILDFKEDSIVRWDNGFKAKYFKIKKRIEKGELIIDLEDEIQGLAIELIHQIREYNLEISGYPPLGISASNGHFYALSNSLEIGWHFDWENKYKM